MVAEVATPATIEAPPLEPMRRSARLDPGELGFAGGLSVLMGLTIVPLTAWSIYLGVRQGLARDGMGDATTTAVGSLLLTAGQIYLLWQLRRVLVHRLGFTATDGHIGLVAITLAVGEVFGLVASAAPTSPTGLIGAVGAVVALIVFLVVYLMFSLRLLQVPEPPYSALRPFAYLGLASSICAISIVLSPLALLTTTAAFIALGVLFFQAAR